MELKLNNYMIGKRSLSYLLIVPYGIETEVELVFFGGLPAFNRTLWN